MYQEGNIHEKNRARLARCLARWIRLEGGRIPATEDGITEHQSLVDAYRDLYGEPAAGSLRQYESTYANIREGIKAERTANAKANEVMEAEAARQRAEDERLEAQRVTRIEDSLRRDAKQTLAINAESVPYMQAHADRLTTFIEKDMARCDRLTSILESDRYRNHPELTGDIKKNLKDAQARMDDFIARRAGIQDGIYLRHRQDEQARAVLARYPREGDRELEPAAEPEPESETDGQWHPRWNKPPRSKFRELTNIPDEWDASKVVLIWRGEDHQELRVFGNDPNQAMADLFGPIAGWECLSATGHRHDYLITREQYAKVGE